MDDELWQLRHERDRLQELYSNLLTAHDEDIARGDNEQQRIQELNNRIRELQRLADQRAEAADEVDALQDELASTRAARLEAERRANNTTRQLEELRRTLDEKVREMELQQKRYELAQHLEALEAGRKFAAAQAAAAAAAASAESAQAAQAELAQSDNAVDPSVVAAQIQEIQRYKDLLDEKNAEIEELRRQAEARLLNQGPNSPSAQATSLADELTAVSLDEDLARQRHALRLEAEARQRAEAERRLRELEEARSHDEAERQALTNRLQELERLRAAEQEAARAAQDRLEEAEAEARRIRLKAKNQEREQQRRERARKLPQELPSVIEHIQASGSASAVLSSGAAAAAAAAAAPSPSQPNMDKAELPAMVQPARGGPLVVKVAPAAPPTPEPEPTVVDRQPPTSAAAAPAAAVSSGAAMSVLAEPAPAARASPQLARAFQPSPDAADSSADYDEATAVLYDEVQPAARTAAPLTTHDAVLPPYSFDDRKPSPRASPQMRPRHQSPAATERRQPSLDLEAIVRQLVEMFPQLGESIIRSVVEKYKGNMEACVQELLRLAAAREQRDSRPASVRLRRQESSPMPSTHSSTSDLSRTPSTVEKRRQAILAQRSRAASTPVSVSHTASLSQSQSPRSPMMATPVSNSTYSSTTASPMVAAGGMGSPLSRPARTPAVARDPGEGQYDMVLPGPVVDNYELAVEQYKIEQQERRREFNVTLPSQETCYPALAMDSQDSLAMGLHRDWSAHIQIKVSVNYVTVMSTSSFQPIIEWPLPLIKYIACNQDKFMIEGWVERRQRTGLLVLKTSEASAIFKQTAKYLHEYTAKRDAALARDMQKQELAGVMDISDDFLAELRLNVEFNRLLAQVTRRPESEIERANDMAYRAFLKAAGKRPEGRKALDDLRKQYGSPKSGKRGLFGLRRSRPNVGPADSVAPNSHMPFSGVPTSS